MFTLPATESDYLLSSYAFELPEELIAQQPCAERGADRLYLLNRQADSAEGDELAAFGDLPALLPPNSLLVANNSKVARARLLAKRPSGGLLEVLLLSPPPLLAASALKDGKEYCAPAQVLLRPAKKIKLKQRYELAPGLSMLVVEKQDFGQAEVQLCWSGGQDGLSHLLAEAGRLPLPPYIKREPSEQDAERYQTVYADEAQTGSLAAPTAGLHFTPKIRQALEAAGHSWAELTLFVGYGTFSPVRVPDIRAHQMHAEYAELPEASVRQILAAKAEGRPIFAVGTTSARVLEGLAAESAAQPAAPLLAPRQGWLNCFLHPGKPIRVIDGLITNFHLPESTLLMLVSALSGRERLLGAYRRAIRERFRFFSYGDAMLIR